jgi:signal transduction histidine kinase
MTDTPLFRSSAVRFALVYAVLLTLSAMLITSFLWWSTAGLLDRQTESSIQIDAQGLSDRWQQGGIPALVLTIDERLTQNIEDDSIYLLIDPQGRRVAGNLERWPPVVTTAGPYYEIPIQRAGIRTLARVQRWDLPGGFRLLIGRDVQVRARLRTLLKDALLWAVLIVLAVAAFGGVLVRNLFQRSLANVSATATAIAAGDFAQRVKLSGRGDELDQLAEVINEMLDRIGRLMEGVRQVSNAIAHDLRTPITRARARLEDAALHAETADELRAAIERATTDLDGIVNIFQALLRISEIEAGSRRSSFERVDVVPLLRGVVELYEVLAEERDVTIRVDATPPLMIHGDAALIQQAVANLVDNALKFSPSGGTIRITAVMTPREMPRELIVSVSDQGPGIPEAERAKATERFYRGEAARSTPGSGLGLTLVGAVARLHGGTLTLDDAAPGLKATLSFPLGRDADD